MRRWWTFVQAFGKRWLLPRRGAIPDLALELDVDEVRLCAVALPDGVLSPVAQCVNAVAKLCRCYCEHCQVADLAVPGTQ